MSNQKVGTGSLNQGGDFNFTGGLKKNGVDVATVNNVADLDTDLQQQIDTVKNRVDGLVDTIGVDALCKLFKKNKLEDTIAGALTTTRSGVKYIVNRYGFIEEIPANELGQTAAGWDKSAGGTNLIADSENVANWTVQNADIAPYVGDTPIVGATAQVLTNTTNNAGARALKSTTHTANTTKRFTWIVRKVDDTPANSVARLESVYSGGSTISAISRFDCLTGTFTTLSPLHTSPIIKKLAHDFWLVSVTQTDTGSNNSAQIRFALTTGDFSIVCLAACMSPDLGFLYTKTIASPVTQDSDKVTLPVLDNIPRVDEPWECRMVLPDGIGGFDGNFRYLMQPSLLSGRFNVFCSNGTNTIFYRFDDNILSTSVSRAFTPNVYTEVFFGYDGTQTYLAVNGSLVTSTGEVAPPQLDVNGVLGVLNDSLLTATSHLDATISEFSLHAGNPYLEAL